MRAKRICEICLCVALMGILTWSPGVSRAADPQPDNQCFVKVSARDNRYFELTNGRPFVPIGLNMIAPRGGNEQEALKGMEQWISNLSENRGNYIRLWLSNDFFDVEHEHSGQYDAEKAKRIDAVLEMARRHDIRVKMTIEHFRHFFGSTQSWAAKPLHHVSRGGPAEDVNDFFQGQKSREQFKKKLAWYADRYGDEPAIFAWELWNEMDTVRGKGYLEWTEEMLAEIKRLFPKNMVTQSLGSFDNDSKRERYRRLCLMTGNDFANVHRYLDLGASLEVCKGPVDVLAADAILELQNFRPAKPILLAESGAVQPSHSGPFKLYQKDKAGVILHDVTFAPFFVGAAGTGQNWHWDQYVAANNLWFAFDRFAEAIKGIDPPAEAFEPIKLEDPRLRIYILKGRHTLLAWCRDKQNTWQTELAEGKPPEIVENAIVSLPETAAKSATVSFYDPWSNRWTEGQVKGNSITLPQFIRSIIIKMEYSSATREIHPVTADSQEEFETIANSLKPGDELVLHGGTYSQNERRAVTAQGTADKPIVIRAAEGEEPILTRPANGARRFNNIEFVDCAHLVVRGLRFRGGSSGVRFIRGHHVTFEQCEISQTTNNALTMNSGDCDAFVIRKNHIHHTGLAERGSTEGEGMYIGVHTGSHVTTNTLVEGNYIHHLRGVGSGGNDGIEIKFGSYGNIVRDNVIHDTNIGTKYPGIFVYGGGKGINIVEGNVIWNAGEGIQVVSDAIIRNNVIFNCEMTGITSAPHAAVPHVRNVQIVNNTLINHPKGVLIRWHKVQDMIFANNAIYCAGSTAIDASGANNGTFSANYIEGRLTGATIDGSGFRDGRTNSEVTKVPKVKSD